MSTIPPVTTPATREGTGSRCGTSLLWAVATFAVLVLCSILLVMGLTTGGQLPALEQGPSWTPPAAATAPTAAAADTQQSDTQSYLPGDVLQNVSGGRVNLRRTPGFQGKPGEDVIAVLQAGELATVIGGPEQIDGLHWWLVRFNQAEGWMAERSNSGKVLLGPAP